MLEQLILDRAKQLIGEFDMVISYRRNSNPERPSAAFFKDITSIEKHLCWNRYCSSNLSVYLPFQARNGTMWNGVERAAVFIKDCDFRSALNLIAEEAIERDRFHFIGVPCEGMFDYRTGNLPSRCMNCKRPDAAEYDESIGQPVENLSSEPETKNPLKSLAPDQINEFWEKQLSLCIRCNACREACPNCYCRDKCLADARQPDFLSRSEDLRHRKFFQVIRTLHNAGRCTECGECERACPAGIPLSYLSSASSGIIAELFNYLPGITKKKQPLLLLDSTPGGSE